MFNYFLGKGIFIIIVGEKIYLEFLFFLIFKCKCRVRNYYLLCKDCYFLSLDS